MSWRARTLAVIVGLVFWLVASTGLAFDCAGRAKKGLVGPVRTVRTVKVFPEGRRVGQPMQSTYDIKGNEVETIFYNWTENREIGSPYVRQVHTYDDKGNLTETAVYNRDGSLSGKTVYTYRPKGDQTEVTSSYCEALGHRCGNETVETYDARGNRGEDISYYEDGSIRHKETYTCDAKGRVAEMVYWDPHGPDAGRVTYAYDARGNVIEEAWRNADGSIRSKTVYTYEFDSVGNWNKQTAPRGLVTHRTITYYPGTEDQKGERKQ